MQANVGCDYISNLPSYKRKVWHEMKRLPLTNYDIKQLEDFSKYEFGIPAEDARYVLPNAAETKIVATFNVRSLMNFFSLRCCNRAQWEIRQLAEKMLAECKKAAPVLFENAGPTCVSEGICREGAMSCGRLDAILAAKQKQQ